MRTQTEVEVVGYTADYICVKIDEQTFSAPTVRELCGDLMHAYGIGIVLDLLEAIYNYTNALYAKALRDINDFI